MDTILAFGKEPFIPQQLQPVICGLLNDIISSTVKIQTLDGVILLSCIWTEPVITSLPVMVIDW